MYSLSLSAYVQRAIRSLCIKAIELVLPLFTQRQLAYMESRFARLQGKGWGSGTIVGEISACCSLFQSPPLILIDIGGNKGLYSQEFLRRFPRASVYIFEPSRSNSQILHQLFSAMSNVSIISAALSDSSGKLTLFSDEPGSGLASLSQRRLAHLGVSMNYEEQVDVVRFDDYWSRDTCHLDVIDYVKIDVEGHELSVLNGFGEVISRVRLIQFEFGGCNIDTKTYFQDYWYFFTNNGFSLYRITPSGPVPIQWYQESDEFFSTTNYIALNKKYTLPESC